MEKCVSKYHKKDQNLDYYLESICFRSMMKSFCSADKENNIFNFPNPFVPLSSCKSLLLKQWHDFSQFYGLYLISLTISPTYCEPAVFLTVVTWRTQVRPAIQPLVELCLFWSALANLWFTERRLNGQLGESLASASSHVTLVFFPGPSFFCTAVAIRFGTPRDLLFHSQAAGASYWLLGDRSGRRKEADGSIPMSPCLLGRDVREQVEKDLLTHNENILYIHAHANALTTGIQCTQIFSIYIGGLQLTLLSRNT